MVLDFVDFATGITKNVGSGSSLLDLLQHLGNIIDKVLNITDNLLASKVQLEFASTTK